MQLKSACKWIMIIGTLLIWTIKFVIRPVIPDAGTLQPLMDVAPNLFGSLLVPFGAYWFFNNRENRLARLFRVSNLPDLRFVCLLGLGLAVINEYLQLIPFFGRTFDLYDILSSVFGALCSYILFVYVSRRSFELAA